MCVGEVDFRELTFEHHDRILVIDVGCFGNFPSTVSDDISIVVNPFVFATNVGAKWVKLLPRDSS